MKRIASLTCVLVVALALIWVIPVFSQEVLYEEHFTDGHTQLEWHPTYGPSGFMTDTMQVRADSTTPEGDGWIGVVARSDSTPVGIAYAGDYVSLTDYSIEAWVYTEVWDDPQGLREGLVIRMLPRHGNSGLGSKFFSFVARFDKSHQILRLSYHEEMLPQILKVWSGDEIPGGAPTESGWHRMKLKAVGDSIWAYWDGVVLSGCPIDLTQELPGHNRYRGYFGFYIFRMWMSDDVEIRMDDVIVRKEEREGIEEIKGEGELPKTIALHQNYPNPFNSTTLISYQLSAVSGPVTLQVYNILGQEVKTLVDAHQRPDFYTVHWDGRDNQGNEVPSGIYLYRLKAKGYSTTRPMVLLR